MPKSSMWQEPRIGTSQLLTPRKKNLLILFILIILPNAVRVKDFEKSRSVSKNLCAVGFRRR